MSSGSSGCVIIMIVMIAFANKISWAWEAYAALEENGWTFSECFRNLSYILSESELTGSYYGDLLIGYLLTLLCSIRNSIQAFKTSGGDYSIQ